MHRLPSLHQDNMETNLAVDIRGLTFKYQGASAPALADINLSVPRGEIVMLMGPTGAGKSTLYMCLNGLIPHLIQGRMSGSVRIMGKDTSQHSISDLSQQVGIVFQDPEVQLFSLTVQEELAFGPENLALAKPEILDRIRQASVAIGLTDILDREPARLSGGQQQQVAIGAVWAMLPDVLIMDEPTSNLDPQGSQRVLRLVKELNRDHGKTILIAEHKIDVVAPIADRVVVIHEGKLVLNEGPREVFAQPDLLHASGMTAPVPTELALRLRDYGVAIDNLPLTVNEFLQEFGKLTDDQ